MCPIVVWARSCGAFARRPAYRAIQLRAFVPFAEEIKRNVGYGVCAWCVSVTVCSVCSAETAPRSMWGRYEIDRTGRGTCRAGSQLSHSHILTHSALVIRHSHWRLVTLLRHRVYTVHEFGLCFLESGLRRDWHWAGPLESFLYSSDELR